MWYFLIQQNTIENSQYQSLQKKAGLTEVELFNEPYQNWYVFSVEKSTYQAFMDHLDREGIVYELTTDRPTHDEMLGRMR